MANTPKSNLRPAKRIAILCVLAACCFLLTSCEPGVLPISQPYSFDRMQQQLRDDGRIDVATTQIDSQVQRDMPKVVDYTCTVEGRDLQFHCTSGVYIDSLFGVPLGWFRRVDTDYADTILEMYRTQADAAAQQVYIPSQSPSDHHEEYFTVHARSEIPQVVAAMRAMDDVYAQEAKYHDGHWLDKPRTVFVYLEAPKPGDIDNDPYRIDIVRDGIALDGINGTAFNEAAVTAQIQAEYQSYEDGTAKNMAASVNYGLSAEQTRQLFAQADR